MTAEEKRDRRQARRDLEKLMLRIATRRMGLFATTGQLKAAARTLTDRYFAEQIRPTAQAIEAELLNSQPTLSDGQPPEPANG